MSNRRRKRRRYAGRNRDLTTRSEIDAREAGDEVREDITLRAYGLSFKTFDEKTRSIEAVLATGARVLVFDMGRWEVLEEILLMDGVRFAKQVPYTDTHDRSTIAKMLGSTRDMRIEGNELIGRNYCANTPEGDRALSLIRDRHLQDNSVSYSVDKFERIGPGESKEVDGKRYRAGKKYALRIAQKWTVKGNAACSIGADRRAKNRSEETTNVNNSERDQTMDKFKEWLTARGLVYDDLDETQRASLQKDFDAEVERAKAPPAKKPEGGKAADDSEGSRSATGGSDAGGAGEKPMTAEDVSRAVAEAIVAGRTAEAERVTAIRAAGEGLDPSVVDECVADPNMTLERAQTKFLDHVRTSRPSGIPHAPNVHSRDNSVSVMLLTDAMLMRAAMDDIVLAGPEGEQRADRADKIRDMALVDICRHALALEGKAVPMGRQEMVRAAFSANSLADILGNIANKSLIKGYNVVEETWPIWCNVGSANDYKPQAMMRLVDAIKLDEVGESGEVKSAQVGDEKELISVLRYAKKFGVDDMAIINDDLNALTEVPTALGRAAKELLGDLVYIHLLANGAMGDAIALFHATHLNLRTSSAFTAANLKLAITAFAQQKIKKGTKQRRVNVQAKYLVIPPELKFAALEILNSSLVVATGTTDLVVGNKNVLQNAVEPISETRLSDSAITGYSATSWYLAGDKGKVPTIKVNFLHGRKVPVLEKMLAGPDHFGFFWRIRHDAGAKAADWRNVQKNNA